mmetsp:Transcript_21589/g.67716  ORF Transcript_21589/g.67716 Transcript_21589/m.67716 type:complete len:243 (-) Transcript_21589:322-1050(-)
MTSRMYLLSLSALALLCTCGKACNLFIIVSGQRSGSSSLSETVSKLSHGRVANWNEVFNRDARQTKLLEWIQDRTKFWHRCENPAEVLADGLTNLCNSTEQCGASVKLFDTHCRKRKEDTRGWADEHLLRSVLNLKNACYVVLERNPAARECSLDWAYKTRDWGITPGAHAAFLNWSGLERPACSNNASTAFQETHDGWFRLVRQILHENRMPFLDIRSETFMDGSHKLKDIAGALLAFGGF